MEFNLKETDAMALDLPVLSGTESIIQVQDNLAVGCTTPQKSHSIPSSGSSLLECENVNLGIAYATPQKSWSVPFCGSSYTPECDESLKPAVGMTFEDLDSAKEFYKGYAAHVGFPIRVGQHKVKNGVVTNKRFYCSKEGFRKAKDETQSEPEHNKKKKCERKIT